uniref:F-box domain-containing protein n=1 Tax=Steinernema glaseri TaxID=37863 RepID=A0A1I7Z8S3_9BILA
MDSVPNVFIERVTGILPDHILGVLRRGGAILGRWASAHSAYTSVWLHITIRDGTKVFRCCTAGRLIGFKDVLASWNNATCYFEAVNFIESPWEEFQPMSDSHFDTVKKMIARQRRRICSVDIQECVGELLENVADILKVCGGVEKLTMRTDIAPIEPIVKKLISDGGVRRFYMRGKPFSDWLVSTLNTQLHAGNLIYIELSLIGDDDEFCESLVRMAMSHILKQEHKYYSLSHPTEYVHLHRPLQEELKYLSSKATSYGIHYSHPEDHTKVTWTVDDIFFIYSWKKNMHY